MHIDPPAAVGRFTTATHGNQPLVSRTEDSIRSNKVRNELVLGTKVIAIGFEFGQKPV